MYIDMSPCKIHRYTDTQIHRYTVYIYEVHYREGGGVMDTPVVGKRT